METVLKRFKGQHTHFSILSELNMEKCDLDGSQPRRARSLLFPSVSPLLRKLPGLSIQPVKFRDAIHHQVDRLDRGLRQDSVPEIEDMAGLAPHLREDVIHLLE